MAWPAAPPQAWSGHHGRPSGGTQLAYGHGHRVRPAPLPRRSSISPALYVVGSFALMMVLAAMASVLGSIAALALLDDGIEGSGETTEVATPAASLKAR